MVPRSKGRESRKGRVRGGHSGAWATSSQDFARLANLLFDESVRYANTRDGNCSVYALAGIPVLFSALRCLLIEMNAGVWNASQPHREVLDHLANTGNDVEVILNHYTVPDKLQQSLKTLLEIRHEIIHPAHRPGPEASGTPGYLVSFRETGLLQSTGEVTDFAWISQLQSHRLFQWAFGVLLETVGLLVREHRVTQFVANGLIATYSKYKSADAGC